MKINSNTLIGILVLITILIVTIATFSLGCAEPPADPDNETGNATDNIKENYTENKNNGSEEEYIYGDATVEETEILIMESFPVQVQVIVSGYLPDGCTQIHEENIEFNEQEKKFNVHLTTIRPADEMCTQALVPFERNITLDVHGLEKGVYTVDVNGVRNEFELQTDNIIYE